MKMTLNTADYMNLLKSKPDNTDLLIGLGQLYMKKNMFAKAAPVFKKIVKIEPYNEQARFELGTIYNIKNKIKAAVKEYKKTLRINKFNVSANVELGKIYKNRKETKKAEAIFKKVLKKNMGNEQAHFELGNIYNSRKLFKKCINEYEKVLKLNPSHEWALIESAKIYRANNEFDKAAAYFKKALKINKNNTHAHVELGKTYKVLGDYNKSKTELQLASRLDNQNGNLTGLINKINEVKGARRKTPPYRVFFTWGLHYECNYRCSYCNTPKPEQVQFKEIRKFNVVHPGINKIAKAWNKVADKYGSCRIRIDGGEPSVYPDFIRIIQKLSEKHWLQINTNLSFNIDKFIKSVKPEHIRVDASYHPEYASLKDIIRKVAKLKRNGFKVVLSLVAYPELIDKLGAFKKKADGIGVPFVVHPFSGLYKGKPYPASYTKSEVSKICKIDRQGIKKIDWYRLKPVDAKKRRVKKCSMGHMYARIYPNGDVYRCCNNDGLLKLGNLYKGGFSLLREPKVCDYSGCKCWRCMIIKEEKRWLSTWLDDWEMQY